MDLYTWPGGKGIDTFDTDSLIVLTYLRLGKCRINHHICKEYTLDSMRNIPKLTHGINEITGVSNIIEYLRKENYGLEYDLSEEELTRLDSLIASVERRIAPACRWFLWADSNIYGSYTYRRYRSNLPLLWGLWYPRKWREELVESAEFSQLALCTNRGHSSSRYRNVETTLYEGARRCLTALSYVLGKNQFFLGDKPSAIDAYIFGRLWPLLNYDRTCRSILEGKSPHRLIAYIYQNENLIQLCRNIQRACFPSASGSFRPSLTERVEDEEDIANSNRRWISSFFPNISRSLPSVFLPSWLKPYRDLIIFGTVSLLLFGSFAFASGYIGFIEEDEEEYDDDVGVYEEIDE